MPGNLYIGITDRDWYDFLRRRPDLDEVNFWQPGGSRQFKALKPGELFLFKLHSPNNFIVGGGLFTYSTLLPSSLAWEAFGDKNGAESLGLVRQRIEKYRRIPTGRREDYTIGNILLAEPFFFDRSHWIPIPKDWARNIVSGKTYSLDSVTGRDLLNQVKEGITAMPRTLPVAEIGDEMYGDPVSVRPRLGQGAFRVMVTDVYERHCAVTGEKTLPVLDAAHIKPVPQGGLHRVDNGILMRTDIHRLYDRGYVTITPDHSFQVSRRLKDDFDNGEPYYSIQGKQIWVPRSHSNRPHGELLEWHADTVFLK